MSPGPTEIPAEVLVEAAKPIIHHRTPQYRNVLAEVLEGLKYVFQTKNDILIFPSAGTGAMESAVCNLVSPGDKVLVASVGNFGERWVKIAKAYGANVEHLAFQWGYSVDPAKIEEKLKSMPEISVVYTTLSETSTGVENDIKAIGKIVQKYNAVLVVDAVSGMAAVEFKTDEWNVDVVVVGSQKGLMLPPGLSFVSLSNKALELAKKSVSPKFYFSYESALKSLKAEKLPDTPYTSAVSLIMQLKEAIKLIRDEGIENIWKRHSKLASATRAGIQALGLKLFPIDSYSNAVTAINVPDGIDGSIFTKKIRDEYGITLAGGQGQIKGKIFRIGHLGYADTFDVIIAISAVEMALYELGYPVELGAGVKAAEKELLKK